jgi:hypothetical protein
MPDVRHVARQAPGDDEHGIYAYIVAVSCVTVHKRARSGGHPAEAVIVKRDGGFLLSRSGLYLHEDEGPAAPRDQVHLADWGACAAGEDLPALELEPEGGDGLGAAAAPLGPLPLHLSACARS